MRNMADVAETWSKIKNMTRRRHIVEPEEQQGPTQQELDDNAISELGRYPEGEVFIQSLRARLDILEVEMGDAIGDTPKMCEIQGEKKAVRIIISQLEGKERDDGR